MAWIKMIDENEATGSVKQQYESAINRAGRVFNIVKIHGLKPEIMRTFMQLYLQLMHGPSGLSRAQREMIAVVVSKLNKCFYWIEAHAEDLRTETKDDNLVEAIKADYKMADIDTATRQMLEFAEKVTLRPANSRKEDVDRLKSLGFSDADILDIAHITGYFNHINRIADALGVDLEDFMVDKWQGASVSPHHLTMIARLTAELVRDPAEDEIIAANRRYPEQEVDISSESRKLLLASFTDVSWNSKEDTQYETKTQNHRPAGVNSFVLGHPVAK